LAALATATLFLVGLIALITIFPVQAVSQALSGQTSQQQMVLAESLARQCEDYFNGIAYELLDLANHPKSKQVQRQLVTPRGLNWRQWGKRTRRGRSSPFVRLSGDGTELYAWPDDYNQRIQDTSPCRGR